MSNLAEAQKTEMEAFAEHYANTPAAKKWQALGEMYKQMHDVPKDRERRWIELWKKHDCLPEWLKQEESEAA